MASTLSDSVPVERFGNMIRFPFYVLKLELRFVRFDFISNVLISAVNNFNVLMKFM